MAAPAPYVPSLRLLLIVVIGWLAIAMAGPLFASGIPEACRIYQRRITQEAHTTFGIMAPVSTLAAQIHQESACRSSAVSPVGATGLAQFMPATARDMSERYSSLGPPAPMDPRWAIAAQMLYMRELTRAAPGATECDTWAFGLSAYNGGLGWVRRDQTQARAAGKNPAVWFGQVELTPDGRRAAAAVRENRGYPRRILLSITPIYVAGGYGRGITCTGAAQ